MANARSKLKISNDDTRAPLAPNADLQLDAGSLEKLKQTLTERGHSVLRVSSALLEAYAKNKDFVSLFLSRV